MSFKSINIFVIFFSDFEKSDEDNVLLLKYSLHLFSLFLELFSIITFLKNKIYIIILKSLEFLITKFLLGSIETMLRFLNFFFY